MLTSEQEKWITTLSGNSKVKVIQFDPSSQGKFEKIKSKIQSKLGKSIPVEHCGSTSLGISGQDEIDVYIPVMPDYFDKLMVSLIELFGEPKSIYPLERVRFTTFELKKRIDIFLINKQSLAWKNGVKFENYLRMNPAFLKAYKYLKESGNGLSLRQYYRRKIEFINDILIRIMT